MCRAAKKGNAMDDTEDNIQSNHRNVKLHRWTHEAGHSLCPSVWSDPRIPIGPHTPKRVIEVL